MVKAVESRRRNDSRVAERHQAETERAQIERRWIELIGHDHFLRRQRRGGQILEVDCVAKHIVTENERGVTHSERRDLVVRIERLSTFAWKLVAERARLAAAESLRTEQDAVLRVEQVVAGVFGRIRRARRNDLVLCVRRRGHDHGHRQDGASMRDRS